MLSLVFERFTESARRVVVIAQEEARELGHGHVGTEHELLGLLADPDSDASRALSSLGVTADRVRERVMEIEPVVHIGPPGDQRSGRPIPFTPEAKKALELALREALALAHREITPGHVLLGLVHDREGVAMQVLVSLGADQAAIRAAVMARLPEPQQPGPPIPRASQPQPEVVTSDPVIRRLMGAAAGRALDDGRAEFGVRDLLASIADDEDAASAFADLGIDIDTIRRAIQRKGRPEEPTG
jgi:ATP-dependent Clp protease ATP-binding subunit ClpC